MKKSLLIVALMAAGSMTAAMAKSEVFVFDYLGEVDGLADNGQYAAISDPDNGLAYLWRAESPDDLIDITEETDDPTLPSYLRAKGTIARDVSDNGIVVGAILFADGVTHPAYYADGEWNLLPMDPYAMNTNEAIAITPDGKVIAGSHFINDPSSEIGGRYYPCQWFLQDDGTYELKSYSDIALPNHQGFFARQQTPDGRVVLGSVCCGMQSNTNAMIKDGKFVMFDEIVTESEPWIYKGKYYAGTDVREDGTTYQVWVEDANDPRVVYFEEVYINGYKDSEVGLDGWFHDCDINGNLYGSRSYVENVTEDGHGTVYTEGCIYNYLTDTWIMEPGVSYFSTGVGTDLLFTGAGEVMEKDDVQHVADAYEIVSEYTVEGISRTSYDGKTIGGVASEVHPGTGEKLYYPFLVKVDGGTQAAIQSVAGNPKGALVLVSDGRIEVVNASEVSVYDLEGHMVGSSAVTDVNPGIYVVVADGRSYKVIVK